ncbi:MAG: hypothetical protein E7286_07505 [Lachnospiraceae bacterium]|nr:hypothetical protein [Lachnospiraceae bacterium]
MDKKSKLLARIKLFFKKQNGVLLDGKCYAVFDQIHKDGTEYNLLVNSEDDWLIQKTVIDIDGEYFEGVTRQEFDNLLLEFCKRNSPTDLEMLKKTVLQSAPFCSKKEVEDLYDDIIRILRVRQKTVSAMEFYNIIGPTFSSCFSKAPDVLTGTLTHCNAERKKYLLISQEDPCKLAHIAQEAANSSIGLALVEAENDCINVAICMDDSTVTFDCPKASNVTVEECRLVVLKKIAESLMPMIVDEHDCK